MLSMNTVAPRIGFATNKAVKPAGKWPVVALTLTTAIAGTGGMVVGGQLNEHSHYINNRNYVRQHCTGKPPGHEVNLKNGYKVTCPSSGSKKAKVTRTDEVDMSQD